MTLKDLAPWRWGGLRRLEEDDQSYDIFKRDMGAFQREMDRMFEDFWFGGRSPLSAERWSAGALSPSLDQTEDEKAFHVAMELPGMDQDDVNVSLSDGLLTIRGEKKQEDEEKGKDYYRKERSFGSFRRSIPIPGEVDESGIEASFDKGVLSITLPKSKEALEKVRQIPVKAAHRADLGGAGHASYPHLRNPT